jgi:SAM-dependent methyltransferase
VDSGGHEYLDGARTVEGQRLRLLHVGCGTSPLPAELAAKYEEVRVDIDPATSPHIVANMTSLGEIGQYDAIYCCHAIEHLYPYDVVPALREFARVLLPGGFAIVIVPDLQDVRPTADPLWCGVSGLHMIYGNSTPDTPHMAHHSGFLEETLGEVMREVFSKVVTKREQGYQLVGIGVK